MIKNHTSSKSFPLLVWLPHVTVVNAKREKNYRFIACAFHRVLYTDMAQNSEYWFSKFSLETKIHTRISNFSRNILRSFGKDFIRTLLDVFDSRFTSCIDRSSIIRTLISDWILRIVFASEDLPSFFSFVKKAFKISIKEEKTAIPVLWTLNNESVIGNRSVCRR